MITIGVKYSCPTCGLEKARVQVPTRGAEDVVTWMKATTQHIADDHHARSPACPGRTCDVMIPIAGAEKVGGPPIQ